MRIRNWKLLGLAAAGVSCALFLVLWNHRSAIRADAPREPSAQQAIPAVCVDTRGCKTQQTVSATAAAPLVQHVVAPRQAPGPTDRFKYRLANTTNTVSQLLRNDRAILLENALIDTTLPVELPVPEHLRATNDPGAYIVQARGTIDDEFRAALARAGASVVSYIPNNAYPVRCSAATARRLAANRSVQAVLTFEPYYKLKGELLKLAVEREPLPEGTHLVAVLFADIASETIAQLEQLGFGVLETGNSPFGVVAHVRPAGNWTALALLPGVQLVELGRVRVPANDLSRVRVGVAADPITTTNYLGLSGKDVFVAMADSGVDMNHPDLQGRIVLGPGADGADTNGHGTHVAGIIVSSGANGPQGTNVSGSIDGASFRGLAPDARLYVLPVNMASGPMASAGSPAVSDASLQQEAAKTNVLISLNAWNYAGDNSYSIASASYDAAVRDALPGVTGPQPVLFVFAAGNDGLGSDNGLSGNPDSILAPATAKNVLTVGAIEQLRYITNQVEQVTGGQTNRTTPWLGMTDSANEVARFSSRGNVGIGYEGDFGRFKPDVVAPGTFVLSTRSRQWARGTYYDGRVSRITRYADQYTEPNFLNFVSVYVPTNALEVSVGIIPNRNSPVPFPQMDIYVWRGTDPRESAPDGPYPLQFTATGNPVTPGQVFWWFGISNTTSETVFHDIVTRVVTEELKDYMNALSNLNESVGPYYRFESGTSMAAANAAGVLALIQEFFQKFSVTNSPALMKALLINGARSVNPMYDFQVRPPINYQGWGLVRLPTTLHPALTNSRPIFKFDAPEPCSIKLLDQSPTNALATGQSLTWKLEIANSNAVDLPLRITLVWTDPPGNPAASVKLVNDLDLIVTNLDTTNVYVGNDIGPGALFNLPWDGVSTITNDAVNNVENVFIPPRLGTNYSITVAARRVNVNAVTTQTNNVMQDFALVISCGNGEVPDALRIGDNAKPVLTSPSAIEVTYVTNTFQDATTAGALLLRQRAGASFQLLGTNMIDLGPNAYWPTNAKLTLGVTNQWHFYVITNTQNYTNAAFVTFIPPNLGVPRSGVYSVNPEEEATREEADIDLFVARGPNNWALTNLDPVVLMNADKSVSRGGVELVFYTNAQPGEVFYVGIKAEDQMAAEYGFLAVFSLLPFSESTEGGIRVRFFPVPSLIPDGDNAKPGVAYVFGISIHPANIRRAIVQTEFLHQNFGDLVGNLSHNRRFVVLNNHYNTLVPAPPGPYSFVYEDNGEGIAAPLFSSPNIEFTTADSPGSLRNFVGEEALGVWLFTVIDNHLTQTGAVTGLSLLLEPQDLTKGMVATVQPQAWKYFSVDVPPEATNLTVILTLLSNSIGPLDLYVRRDAFPTQTEYDKRLLGIVAPGGALSIGKNDYPPLNAGRYYIGVYNPSTTPQTFEIRVILDLDIAGTKPTIFASTNVVRIFDDAIVTSSIPVNVDRKVARVDVALAVEHPRVSDLAFTLVSPRGTRVLLFENRGASSTNGLIGGLVLVTNTVQFADFAG
ncbi:MAG: S8 family serine peptidase, partial [Verrucomicrobiae bacterium]|nr:S8 family serine peptidase [Verrucomicrobiae bacterium]